MDWLDVVLLGGSSLSSFLVAEVVTSTVSLTIKLVGTSLWWMTDFFVHKSACMAVNSHNVLTSPIANCLDCSRIVHRIDPFVNCDRFFLAALEHSRSALVTATRHLNNGHFLENTAHSRFVWCFSMSKKSSAESGTWALIFLQHLQIFDGHQGC